MRYTNKDIISDNNPLLREKSTSYTFELTKEEKDQLNGLLEYVKNSVNDDLAKKYDLSPAVGLAAIQVGIKKRAFAAYIESNGKVELEQIFINPTIVAHSVEQIYVENGEACLSVKSEHDGIVPRYILVKVHYYDIDGNEHTKMFEEFQAIVIQHEIDHLNGILFYDHIDKKFPFKIPKGASSL